jgi:hypothetical protein
VRFLKERAILAGASTFAAWAGTSDAFAVPLMWPRSLRRMSRTLAAEPPLLPILAHDYEKQNARSEPKQNAGNELED